MQASTGGGAIPAGHVYPPAKEGLSRVVHPMTSQHEVAHSGARLFVEGDGIRLRDDCGEAYVDAMSGLFNVNVGHGRAELVDTAAESMRTIAFASLFFGQGNIPAMRLADKLAQITPAGIDRFFFTLGGSDASDTAVKLVRYYNALCGRPEKVKIIGRRQSYHGMTLGATSMTGDSVYWNDFGPLVSGFIHIDQPDPEDPAAAAELERAILEQGPDTVAAFVAEPISLPAGVNIPGKNYWQAVREICSRHGVLMINDEVVTGFGRTGRMFGIEHWDTYPDIVIMSKGITSGYLPLGAVGMTTQIHETLSIMDRPLLHGFTASGHPTCCAVALRNIEIIEQEGLVENSARVGAYLKARLEALSARHCIAGPVRGLGMLCALDVVADSRTGTRFPPEWQVGLRVREEILRRKVLLRHYGDTLVIGPSLSATRADIDEIVETVDAALGILAAMSENGLPER